MKIGLYLLERIIETSIVEVALYFYMTFLPLFRHMTSNHPSTTKTDRQQDTKAKLNIRILNPSSGPKR